MDIIPATDLADRLNVHPATVYEWIHKGRLSATRIGNMYVVERAVAEAFIASYVKWGR